MTPPTASDAETETTLGQKLGITRSLVTASRTVLTMPVAGNRQPAGVLHGGATAALCEEAGSLAANEQAAEFGKIAVGATLTITHVRPAIDGIITAEATAVHLGARTAVHSVEVKDQLGRVVSTALMTNQLIDPF